MRVLLLTTLPNRVAKTLSDLLGNNLSVLDIIKIEDKKNVVVRIIDECTPDMLITYRCPYILSIDILHLLSFDAYNIHPSLLPKYKGLNPWIEIFRNNETESGVTLHKITQELDSGLIVAQESFKINSNDTVESAREKADEIAALMIRHFISNFNLSQNNVYVEHTI